jgi:L-alanine-DL-glutamate epimerase-like enolase superfamily enzyme
MLITAIESFVVSLPFDMGGPHPLFAGQPWDHLDILVVKVETDDGLVGWGEAFGHTAIPTTKAALDTIVAPLLIGRDAGDINALTRAVLHGTARAQRTIRLRLFRRGDRIVGSAGQARRATIMASARRRPDR